jgi:hypothetical protein
VRANTSSTRSPPTAEGSTMPLPSWTSISKRCPTSRLGGNAGSRF